MLFQSRCTVLSNSGQMKYFLQDETQSEDAHEEPPCLVEAGPIIKKSKLTLYDEKSPKLWPGVSGNSRFP